MCLALFSQRFFLSLHETHKRDERNEKKTFFNAKQWRSATASNCKAKQRLSITCCYWDSISTVVFRWFPPLFAACKFQLLCRSIGMISCCWSTKKLFLAKKVDPTSMSASRLVSIFCYCRSTKRCKWQSGFHRMFLATSSACWTNSLERSLKKLFRIANSNLAKDLAAIRIKPADLINQEKKTLSAGNNRKILISFFWSVFFWKFLLAIQRQADRVYHLDAERVAGGERKLKSQSSDSLSPETRLMLFRWTASSTGSFDWVSCS